VDARTGFPVSCRIFCLELYNEDTSEGTCDLSGFGRTLEALQSTGKLAVTPAVACIRFARLLPRTRDLSAIRSGEANSRSARFVVFHGAFATFVRVPDARAARRPQRYELQQPRFRICSDRVPDRDFSFSSDEVWWRFCIITPCLSCSTRCCGHVSDGPPKTVHTGFIRRSRPPWLRSDKNLRGGHVVPHRRNETGSFGQRYLTADGLAWVRCAVAPHMASLPRSFVASPHAISCGTVCRRCTPPTGCCKYFRGKLGQERDRRRIMIGSVDLGPGHSSSVSRTTLLASRPQRKELSESIRIGRSGQSVSSDSPNIDNRD